MKKSNIKIDLSPAMLVFLFEEEILKEDIEDISAVEQKDQKELILKVEKSKTSK